MKDPARWPAVLFIVFACIVVPFLYSKSSETPASSTEKKAASATAHAPSPTAASLHAGRELFTAKCGMCHEHADITKFQDAEWPGIVDTMGQNAELDATQSENVLQYILAERAALRVWASRR